MRQGNALKVVGYVVSSKFFPFAEKELMRKAQNLRKASVSKSTLKTRERQWLCYLIVLRPKGVFGK